MNRKLKILIIVSTLNPGGMERLVTHLGKGLLKRKITTKIICIKDYGELGFQLKDQGFDIESLKSFKSMDLKAIFKLSMKIRKFNPSVIHIHDYSASFYGVPANIISKRASLIFTGHGLLYLGFDELKKRCRLISRGFSKITAVSPEVGKRHEKYLNHKKTIEIIENGVPKIIKNFESREKIRKELRLEKDDFLFLSIGNPRPEKGFEDLIDSVSMLMEKTDKKFKVAIAGKIEETPYCSMLLKKIEHKNLRGKIEMLGFRQDTEALYSAADCFLLSSRSEGMPMVILEAMTAGLPIITTAVGGIPGVVKDCGIIVPRGTREMFAESMEKILKDKKLAENLGEKAEKSADNNFGVDAMVEKYINCYRKVLN